MRKIYDQMIARLTLRQFYTIMGGDMSYRSKAERAKKVSRSKTVHRLADMLIEEEERLVTERLY